MKQVTVTIHFDEDMEAEAFYVRMKDLQRTSAEVVYSFRIAGGRDNIRDVEIKGPND